MCELAIVNGISKEKIERAVRDGKAAFVAKRCRVFVQVTFSMVHLAETGMTEEAATLAEIHF